jgi:hypothetical protein
MIIGASSAAGRLLKALSLTHLSVAAMTECRSNSEMNCIDYMNCTDAVGG